MISPLGDLTFNLPPPMESDYLFYLVQISPESQASSFTICNPDLSFRKQKVRGD